MNVFKIFFAAVTLLCIMTSLANAGKMTGTKKTVVAPQSSSTENAATEIEGTTTAPLTQPVDGKQSTNTADVSSSSSSSEDEISFVESLGIWGIVSSLWNWIRDDIRDSLLAVNLDADNDDVIQKPLNISKAKAAPLSAASSSRSMSAVEGRTFGKIRRLQMALIPIVFKFGVLSAMVAFLVMLGIKTIFLLKFLILMNAVAILGKFLTLKTNFGSSEHSHIPSFIPWNYANWNPHASIQSGPGAPSKEIHLHIHGAQAQPQVSTSYSSYGHSTPQLNSNSWERRSDPYAAYEPATITTETESDNNEVSKQRAITALPDNYAANHRY